MRKKWKRFTGVCLVLVMLICTTCVVNAGSIYGSIYGYNGGGTVTTTSSSISANAFAQPESSTEPDIIVRLDGVAYKSNGTSIAYVYAEDYRSCSDSATQLIGVSYGLCSFWMHGYYIGQARG